MIATQPDALAHSYQQAERRHNEQMAEAAVLANNLAFLLGHFLNNEPMPEGITLADMIEPTREGLEALAPWAASLGFVAMVHIRPYELDPVGYFCDWHGMLWLLRTFAPRYVSPAGLAILAAGSTKH